MKLGISINLFDGIELLEPCLNQFTDYVSIVYQRVSNHGQDAPTENEDKLIGLNVISFYPDLKIPPTSNEVHKRNIGLEDAIRNGCTHFMSVDVDEFYDKEQLEYAKRIIEEEDFDSSVCQLQTYYKEPCYRYEIPEEYYVPLIYKIRKDKWFSGMNFPKLVDPTRKQEPGNIKVFCRDEIEMHHLSYVRDNIRCKLENSSAKINFKSKIDKIVEYYDNWKFPDLALIGGLPPKYVSVIKVDAII